MSAPKPMEAAKRPSAIKKVPILFPNKNKAVAVYPAADQETEGIVAALEIKSYKAVILVLGGAATVDEKLVPRLTQLFSRGVARAAANATAVIMDGGTQAGVMALMGEGVAGRGFLSPLIGVAPVSLVTHPGSSVTEGTPLEPNHSHFVLVEGDSWGAETPTMFNLAKVLRSNAPGVGIVVGGGAVSSNEVLRAVRQNLPLIVVEGSGGLADEIAAAWKQRPTLPDDPVMAEIIADGGIQLHLLSNSVKGIERLIIRELGGDNVLMEAWEVFADYDSNANLQQKKFNSLQKTILIVGVVGTALAITKQVWRPGDPVSLPRGADGSLVMNADVAWWSIHQFLIIIPILLTVLVTAASRFKQGSKWLLLRGGAESIKREIYRYRARAMFYKDELNQPSPEQQLSKRVEDITRRTMQTEVNTSALVPYNKDQGFPPYMYAAQGGDDGFSYLTPDRYLEVRLGDQLSYYKKTCSRLERQLKLLTWLTFIVGGVGTYLAATGRQVWIALTTAIVAAIGTYLAYRQTESSLTKYNQAGTDLANVKTWWNALSAEEQSQQKNIDSLVEHTEQVLQSELDGWVQQMQNALAAMRQDGVKDEDNSTGKEGAKGNEPSPAKPGTDPKRPDGEATAAADPAKGATGAAAGAAAKPPAETVVDQGATHSEGEEESDSDQEDAQDPSSENGGEAEDSDQQNGADTDAGTDRREPRK